MHVLVKNIKNNKTSNTLIVIKLYFSNTLIKIVINYNFPTIYISNGNTPPPPSTKDLKPPLVRTYLIPRERQCIYVLPSYCLPVK